MATVMAAVVAVVDDRDRRPAMAMARAVALRRAMIPSSTIDFNVVNAR